MSANLANADLHDLSVFDLAAKLAARDVSSVEVTQHFLARVKSEQRHIAHWAPQ